MQIITFKKIRIKNFMSFGKQWTEFNFEKHKGTNYVFGINNDLNDTKNGAGKTTIFVEALLFSVFGRTSKNINKTNIVNRSYNKDCVVELLLETNNKTYKITSSIKPTNLVLEELKDDKFINISKSSIKETQSFIENEIICSSYEVFKSTVILSVTGAISVYNMTKHDKRDFVEKSFKLMIIGMMFKKVKEDINKLEKEIINYQTLLTKYENDIVDFNKQILTFTEDKQNKIKTLYLNLKELNDELVNIDCLYEQLEKDLILVKNDHTLMKTKIDSLESLKIKLQNDIQSLNKEITLNTNFCSKYTDILSIVCNDCTDKVTEKFKLLEAKQKIEECNNSINNNKENINKIDHVLEVLYKKLTSYTDNIKKLENDINFKKIQESKKKGIEIKIENIKNMIKDEEIRSSPLSTILDKYKSERDIAYKNISDRMYDKKHLDYMYFMLSEDGVKKFIVSTIVTVFNSRIRKYLDELNANYTVLLSPDFNAQFLTQSGECEYGNFSSGEQRRLECATSFALRDILFAQGALRTNILVCDEILDVSLDETAVNNLVEILKREATNASVFIISHRECVEKDSGFDNIIEIEKTNNQSFIKFDSLNLKSK